MTTTIAMPSLTHAMKGQKVLQAAGYHTQVHKTKQGNVLRLLEQSAVPFLSYTEE